VLIIVFGFELCMKYLILHRDMVAICDLLKIDVLLREIINIGAFGQVLIIGQTDSGFLLDSILHVFLVPTK